MWNPKFQAADNFNQIDFGNGINKVHANHPFRIFRGTGDFRQAEGRRIARQNDMAWANLIQLLENFFFGVHIFRNGLDDHIAGAEFGKMSHFVDPG
ncbi:hypothetical protein HMSSN036_53010 [Paenibacillus macerans]|nr:hypothetical protein HMSSN036_53010 [Paenibacillus macerans]